MFQIKTTVDDRLNYWSLWDIFHAFLLVILSGTVFYIIGLVANEILLFKVPEELSGGLINSLSIAIGTFYLIKEYPVKLYGFDKNNIKQSLILGVCYGLFLSAIQFPFKTILYRGEITFSLFVSIKNGIPFVLISLIFATIVAPIVEELFFRSCIFRILKNKLGKLRGYLGTAIIFSLLHYNGPVIKFFVCSLILTYLYERRGLIAPCIIAHSIWNMVWFLSMYAYEFGLFA